MASPRSPAASPTSSPGSINSRSTPAASPLPTAAPRPERSEDRRQLYRAYAVPLDEAPPGQENHNNPNQIPTPRASSPRAAGRARRALESHDWSVLGESAARSDKGKEREWDAPLVRSDLDDASPDRRRARTPGRPRRARRGFELGYVADLDDARKSLEKRLPTAQGYPSCNFVGNGVLSCYPESNTTIVQGDYSKFIWNAQYPTFIGAGDVDIYLYNANTEAIATSWLGVQNARGMIGIVPDEEWWPTESANEWFNSDRNQTIPYYFIVVDGGSQLTGGETHQSTFTVIQTAAPTSLSSTLAVLTASSLSSVSSASAASASSVASQLSQSSAAASSRSGSSSSSSRSTTNANGELQPSSGGGGGGPAIPKWAIAIIVILGFFALVAGAFAIVFCLGRARKRRRASSAGALAVARGGDGEGLMTERERFGGVGAAAGGAAPMTGTDDGFSTNGSREPMLGSPSTGGGGGGAGLGLAPPLGVAAGAGAGGAALGAVAGGARDDSDDEKEESGGLDRNDAARMAEAFRAALRRPEFPHTGGTESSGESAALTGGGEGEGGAGAGEEAKTPGGEGDDGKGRELMEEELRSEGMRMRDVEGGRGKRWG
ncbi:hypothetical protein JCM11491_003145 [Sporobolomyces phaffii]